MLRALVVALLLANLAFYAWTLGWLDSVVGVRAIGDREPERMARQVRPETVRILSTGGASSADSSSVSTSSTSSTITTIESAPTAFACLEAGPFSENQLAAAQAAALAAVPGGGWVTTKTEQPGTWIVYMGRYADREALHKKEEELKRRKLSFEEILAKPGLSPGLSLGSFADRALATKAIEQFAQLGIRTARVVETAPASTSEWLRAEKADAALAAKLTAVKADALGNGFVACAKPPGT